MTKDELLQNFIEHRKGKRWYRNWMRRKEKGGKVFKKDYRTIQTRHGTEYPHKYDYAAVISTLADFMNNGHGPFTEENIQDMKARFEIVLNSQKFHAEDNTLYIYEQGRTTLFDIQEFLNEVEPETFGLPKGYKYKPL